MKLPLLVPVRMWGAGLGKAAARRSPTQ